MYTIPSADTYIDIPGYHISPDPTNPYLPILPHLHSPTPTTMPYPYLPTLPNLHFPSPPMHTLSMFTQLN